ncbi:hypothetical protein IFM89_007437 [Coptis chinensis]|uniref:Uncharacterized protein n=1 Tax=Coptis chinensis TaxID=261450 RepID=A0A835M467_9MAGN|nr:hypothetical protein IFM89_007437 [Coptis chinensis]
MIVVLDVLTVHLAINCFLASKYCFVMN